MVHVPLATELTQAIFDPGTVILAAVETSKSIGLWTGQLHGATCWRSIGSTPPARSVSRPAPRRPRRSAARPRRRSVLAVRGAAAEALGAIRGDDARTALIPRWSTRLTRGRGGRSPA